MPPSETFWTCFKNILPGFSLTSTLVACGLLIFFYALFSGSETGLYRLNRLRLHLTVRNGDRRALILDRLFDDPQVLISIFVVGANVCGYLTAAFITIYLRHQGYSPHQIELWTTVILTPVFAIFCEILPKNCFYAQANSLMLRSAKFIYTSYTLIRYIGLVFVLRFFSRLILQIAHYFGRSTAASADWDDFGLLLREGLASGPLSGFQGTIAERLLRLPDIPLSRSVIPLARTISLPLEIPRNDFLVAVRKFPYTRLPIYEAGPRNIVGFVSIYEVLAEPSNRPPKDFIRPIFKIPADVKLIDAFDRMRKNSARMAAVVDRSGHAIGIVTIKDLLGQIIGDYE